MSDESNELLHIADVLTDATRGDGSLTEAVEQIAHALHIIQTDATQAPLGSIELLAREVKNAGLEISNALDGIADALKGRRD